MQPVPPKGVVLVTGAGGFIGSRLVRTLIARGYQVRAADLPHVDLAWATKLGAEVVACDLTSPQLINAATEGIDTLIHTAAIFDLSCPRETILRTNVEGTRHHCDAAVRHGVRRMVMFSTTGVYGTPRKRPCTEAAPKRPRNRYEISKWRSEKIAMEYNRKSDLEVTALRPTLVYGPGSGYGQAMYLSLFILLREWGVRTLPFPRGGNLTHHVHVDDVVDAAILLATANGVAGHAFNVADEKPVRAEALLSFLCNAAGIKPKPLPRPLHLLTAPAVRALPRLAEKQVTTLNRRMARHWPKLVQRHGLRPALTPRFDMGWLDYLVADFHYDTRSLRLLGWKPQWPSVIQGLSETLTWYRENRWLPDPTNLDRSQPAEHFPPRSTHV